MNQSTRAFRVGVAGPVGSGKTALVHCLSRELVDRYSLAVVTNDIYTKEDAEFLLRQGILPAARVRGVETGGCPHTAIRDDASMNLEAIQQLEETLPGLELVLVETRVRDLLDAAEASVAAGKHIHLDKPAGSSLPQFRRILEAAERQQLLVQMGYMYRYSPAIVMLRDFLQRGWLGEPFEVHAVMSKQVGMEKRASWNEQPGGTMFELGCHLVDLVVGVMGKPDQVTAYPRRTIAGDGLQDNMLAVFEYPKATATIKSTALEVEGFDRRHLVVCGTEGTFHIQPLDRPQARLALSQERGKYQKDYQDVTFPKYSRYVDDAADIARVIRGEKSSEFSYAHDLTVQTAVLEASAMSTD